ncbi:hypothetical protein [Actinacidiphila acididurans]|uniref:Uncharacterized protein n=1 Tax=Actinacidiphila acididurans TaxID=2784346 RepID=A0ABS2TTK9_9ACTN|nr:hypothetical protein [Actinacidiphila acididurans]MBM9506668.1 hypothetical protein [Actinacidiphila acididurans]
MPRATQQRDGSLAPVIVGLFVRQAAATVFNGIPSNARLHLTVRSRRARLARERAWTDMRERIDELATAVPSAHLVGWRYVDRATRASRVRKLPMFGSGPRGTELLALTGSLYAEAYFGTDADPEPMLRKLNADTAHPLLWRATHRPGWPAGRWDQDSPHDPLLRDAMPSTRSRLVILRTERTEPAGWSLDSARTQYGALLRWSAHTTYLTVHRHPWLRGLQRRLWRRLRRSGPARPGRA